MELSFEYFPPRTEKQREQLRRTRAVLADLNAAFCSVTFGAGGSTRDVTAETVFEINREPGPTAAPHVSCMAGSAEDVSELLSDYRSSGVAQLVALRGDRPSGAVGDPDLPHAEDLVRLVRKDFGDAFRVNVACYPECHPESISYGSDLEFFERKVKAGADAAITQYFFNADAYFRFVDACQARGMELPIIPGIMPISNYRQLANFSERCGAEIPRWLEKQLQNYGDNLNDLREFGADFVANMCRRLIDGGAPGLHIYTLNRGKSTKAICERLGT